MIKPRRIILMLHVARMWIRGMRIGFWWVKPEGKRTLQIPKCRWKIILKWFLERLNGAV
jgi:hypothetical protein